MEIEISQCRTLKFKVLRTLVWLQRSVSVSVVSSGIWIVRIAIWICRIVQILLWCLNSHSSSLHPWTTPIGAIWTVTNYNSVQVKAPSYGVVDPESLIINLWFRVRGVEVVEFKIKVARAVCLVRRVFRIWLVVMQEGLREIINRRMSLTGKARRLKWGIH